VLSIDRPPRETKLTEVNKRAERYWCVVGHEISRERLDVETEIRTLDQGAEVRVCVEHGAPIAVTME
jgi:hypothetical protein